MALASHERARAVATAVATVSLASALVLAGCAGGSDGSDGSDISDGSGSDGSDGAPEGLSLPTGDDPASLDPAELGPDVDNPYFPLTPGTRWTYRETDGEGGVQDVVVTATTETVELANGVTARVVRDTVSEDGEVVEDTFDWYAQDADGTVWYLGEDTAEFEDGEVSTREGSFEAGVDGALAGVIMPAEPQVGMTYRQEHYAGHAEDEGAVLALDQPAEVPAGRYADALLTRDTTPLEPDVAELKLYAPGVGLVLTLDVSGGAGREELLDRTTVPEADARAAGTTPLGEDYGLPR